MTVPASGLVRYGEATLSDVVPSVLSSHGLTGPNPLDLSPTDRTVILLIDGLGWNLLQAHAEDAPFMSSLAGRSLTAGFPTTTAASLASLGTGLPSGQHGITGYTSRLPELAEPINWLAWQGSYSGKNMLDVVAPEQAQPHETAFERGVRAGLNVTVASAHQFRTSGLTRAIWRGAEYRPTYTAADTATVVAATMAKPGLVYCYNSELDLIGHGRGCGSETWRLQLTLIDRAVELLAERLPTGTRLLVTGDHGMVDVPDPAKIDYDSEPILSAGVALIAGEARARYLHVAPEDLDRVRQNWIDRLGPTFAVVTRDEAIERGWFCPDVTPTARERIGDLLVLALGDGAVVRRRAEQRLARLTGHHGSLTPDELLVPLLQLGLT